jgi:hypothetical protein
MKRLRCHIVISLLIPFALLTTNGCAPKPVLKMPESLPSIVKEYKQVTISGSVPGLQSTGVFLTEKDLFSVLGTGTVWLHPARSDLTIGPESDLFYAKIGKQGKLFQPTFWAKGGIGRADAEGLLCLGIREGQVRYEDGSPYNPEYYENNSGSFNVDIILWTKEDYGQIVEFLEKMKARDPQNNAVADVLERARLNREFQVASVKATKQIEQTKEEIQALIEERREGKVEDEKPKVEVEPEASPQESSPSSEAQDRSSDLKARLAQLTETLAQLEEMKRKLQDERAKSNQLREKLEQREKREKDLLVKLEQRSKAPPVIVIAAPADDSRVEVKVIHLSGVVEDDEGVVRVEISVNGKQVKEPGNRGIHVTGEGAPKRVGFDERLPLQAGINQLKIRAEDSDGLYTERMLTVHCIERRKNVWAVVIGINNYPGVRHLEYAINDAKAFYGYLINQNQIPAENATLLLDAEASLTRIKSALGTQLKEKAGAEDMVIIFFAGHGATEKDAMNPDGDGLEKYLLPYDVDPKDLYATALPMAEVSRIFGRIRSERLVFIADSCYSGASGGRTIGMSGIRARISEDFLDRISSGKGRVILTASGANEVSAEKCEFQHGVFTHHLLEGLKGKADADKDGIITVDEAYAYVSHHVPLSTGQEQHPVKKGTVEGTLILGITPSD